MRLTLLLIIVWFNSFGQCPPNTFNFNYGCCNYREYVALIEQTGTSDPVVIQTFTNTLGGTPIWTRDTGSGLARFRCTLTNSFTLDKTVLTNYKSVIDLTTGYLLSLNGSAYNSANDDYIELTPITSGAPADMPNCILLVAIIVYP